MTKDDGGPAFPVADGNYHHVGGMTLHTYAAIKLRVADSGIPWLDEMISEARRAEYAGLAMQGLIQGASIGPRGWLSQTQREDFVAEAFAWADAMIEGEKK